MKKIAFTIVYIAFTIMSCEEDKLAPTADISQASSIKLPNDDLPPDLENGPTISSLKYQGPGGNEIQIKWTGDYETDLFHVDISTSPNFATYNRSLVTIYYDTPIPYTKTFSNLAFQTNYYLRVRAVKRPISSQLPLSEWTNRGITTGDGSPATLPGILHTNVYNLPPHYTVQVSDYSTYWVAVPGACHYEVRSSANDTYSGWRYIYGTDQLPWTNTRHDITFLESWRGDANREYWYEVRAYFDNCTVQSSACGDICDGTDVSTEGYISPWSNRRYFNLDVGDLGENP